MDTHRKISDVGLAKLKQWEGLRLAAYRDSAGILTIGYGHTSDAAMKVVAGQTITEGRADELLRIDLDDAEEAVSAKVKVTLTDNQFAALVSFAFNVGITAFAKSTLLRKLNKGDYAAVPSELARWNKSGGKVVQGLTNRRAAEAGLWASGAFVSSASQAATPSAPARTLALTPELIGSGAAAAGGVFSAVNGNGALSMALAVAIVIAAGVGAAFFIRRMRAA